jgi:hypothetical protein
VREIRPSLEALRPLRVGEITNAGVAELHLPAGQAQYHEDVQRCRDDEALVARDNIELQQHSPHLACHESENDGDQHAEQVDTVPAFPLASSESQVSSFRSYKPDLHSQTRAL